MIEVKFCQVKVERQLRSHLVLGLVAHVKGSVYLKYRGKSI